MYQNPPMQRHWWMHRPNWGPDPLVNNAGVQVENDWRAQTQIADLVVDINCRGVFNARYCP